MLLLLAVVCTSLGKALAIPGLRGGRQPLGRVRDSGAGGALEVREMVPFRVLAW